jgi:glyoxylase-like metal-dependent hydrolase (beta-lactamase superfamily II)/rhodanese-related sulfurtransferase
MKIETFRTPGLGDATYLLTHEGAAVLVDPQRDTNRFLEAVEDARVKLRYVLETHLHNDYLSGGRDAARRAGAALVLPAAAGAAFDHVPAFHYEEIGDGSGLTIRPIHTPGHTPEHVSYLVLIDGEPQAVFSGGSLLVGSAGRTDLLGMPRAWQLAVLQHGSLQRLAALPDGVAVYPTHGAGSFCTASAAGKSSSTIRDEKNHNSALRHPDAETFARAQLADLQPYPRYYAFMSGINLLGVPPLPEREVPTLTPDDVVALAGTAHVVDARPREAFAAGHIPGALSVELGDQFGVWAGWLVPFDTPLVLVLGDDQDLDEAVVQLARIGYDDVRGVLRGVADWQTKGLALTTLATIDLEQARDALRQHTVPQILDVRAPSEWNDAHLPGSVHAYVPDLVKDVPEQISRDEPVWVMCASGFRATIAGSLLERAGYQPHVLTRGGVPDLLEELPQAQVA